MKLYSAIFAVILIQFVWHEGNCDVNIGDLTISLIADISTILTDGTVNQTGNCSINYDVSAMKFWLYTKDNPNQPSIINNTSDIDSTKRTVFLIHGWGGNANIDYIRVIKDAYLQVDDCNVISVDYSLYGTGNYQSTYCHVPHVGNAIANFICSRNASWDLEDLHVVGHCIGAQVAGFAGKRSREQCGTLGRITGLDPAGPLYQDALDTHRLQASDAKFVDVIHTNQDQYGYVGNCGDVDFYPNCGYFQPGCINVTLREIDFDDLRNTNDTVYDMLQLPFSLEGACSHQRSCYLYAESIAANNFLAKRCLNCGRAQCVQEETDEIWAFMGASLISEPPLGQYVLFTNEEPPYAKNVTGLLSNM